MSRPKDANASETTELELRYTHDSTTSLKGYCDAEAEYIAVGSSCSQFIWIKNRFKDYDVSQDGASFVMTLYYENISAFNFFKNPIQHSQPKHFRHMVEDNVIKFKHIPTAH